MATLRENLIHILRIFFKRYDNFTKCNVLREVILYYSEPPCSFTASYKRKITFRQKGVKLPILYTTELTGLAIDVGSQGLPDVPK